MTDKGYRRYSFEAMTTLFDVLVVHDEPDYARQAASLAFGEVERFERMLNRHDPGSEIGQINRLSPGEWLRVSREVVEVLELAGQAYVVSDGAFDVCYRSTVNGTRPSAMEWLMLSRPESAEPDEPAEFLVGVAPEAEAEGFLSLEIDLGGIGKGFALDKALELLHTLSIDNVLLNSGTSTVLAYGVGPEGDGWTVGVSGDYRPLTGISSTTLHNCALSGSGTAVRGEHIRVPDTGLAAPALAAWARADSAAWTDALSTALMIAPRDQAEALITEAKSYYPTAAIAIYSDTDYRAWGSW